MLSYFRINDPYRLVIIYFLLILFRLPFLISSNWNTLPELSWMIVGERMNEGALLYVGIWDDIGPLSAWAYRLVDLIVGRSQLAFQIFGLILFFFQIFYVNYISLKHKMFNENNYLPALFYGLLGLTFFNTIILSPQLMGLTFVLFSMNNLFTHIETRNKTDANLLNIGLYIGIASLFYLPYIFIIFIHVFSLLFFTNTIQRRYLLLTFGFVFPLFICWIIYFWYGNADKFFGNFLHSLVVSDTTQYLTYKSLFIILGTTIILFITATLKILSGFGFTVFQVRIQKIMFFAALVSLIIYIFYSDKDGYSLIIFFPWVAIYLSHFFLSIKKTFKRELTFLIYFLSIVLVYFSIAYQIYSIQHFLSYDALIINTKNYDRQYAGKKVLVLGPDITPYYYSKQATPYFNWSLSKDQLTRLHYYDNLVAINKNLRSDLPDYIIDEVGLAPKILDEIPLIKEEYVAVKNGLYKRISANN